MNQTADEPTATHGSQPELELTSADFATFQITLNRLLAEVTTAKIRHRALLAVLEEKQLVTFAEYTRHYVDIYERDYLPILAGLLFTEKALRQHYAEWRKADRKRYAVRRSRAKRPKAE